MKRNDDEVHKLTIELNMRAAREAALRREHDELRAYAEELRWAALRLVNLAGRAHDMWDADEDSKVGKLLRAMGGGLPKYREDIDQVHAILAKNPDRQAPNGNCAEAQAVGAAGPGLSAGPEYVHETDRYCIDCGSENIGQDTSRHQSCTKPTLADAAARVSQAWSAGSFEEQRQAIVALDAVLATRHQVGREGFDSRDKNGMESLERWLRSRSMTVWAKQFGHSGLMAEYAEMVARWRATIMSKPLPEFDAMAAMLADSQSVAGKKS